jgi:hypothetical protein
VETVAAIAGENQMKCPYCDHDAQLVTGAVIYPRLPWLHEKLFYSCLPCNAYVGCHDGTVRPAHAAFDPIWKSRQLTRTAAYRWLARELRIEITDCHIGMFDVDTCRASGGNLFATTVKDGVRFILSLDRISYGMISYPSMSSNIYKIRSLGGTLVITLPQRVVKEWSLVAGDEATIKTAKHNGSDVIILEPLRHFGIPRNDRPKKNGSRTLRG